MTTVIISLAVLIVATLVLFVLTLTHGRRSRREDRGRPTPILRTYEKLPPSRWGGWKPPPPNSQEKPPNVPSPVKPRKD